MAPRVNRKIIEKYFEVLNEQAICKLCSHILKSDRVFNLKTHIIKVHKIKEEEFLNKGNGGSGSVTNNAEKKFRKQVLKIEISKKQLFRSYIGLVTEDNIPFNILNSKNFKNIVDPICRGLGNKLGKRFNLNSGNCKNVLQIVSDNIRNSIKNELSQRLLSLKVDSATRLSRSVFGIIAQFIKNDEIQSRILGMIELKGIGASSARNLATEIVNTLTKYEINLSQIVSITSDSGANMIKSTKILSHIFEDGDEGHDDGNEVYLKNIQMFEDSSEMHLGDIQIYRCAAHIAQLCALDVTKDPEIKLFLFSCRNLVKFIKKPSNGYREIFQLKSLTVPLLDCPTRWGSTYNMVKSLKNAKDLLIQVEPIKNKSIDENFELNNSFWDFVEAYCVCFEPLQHTIIKFQEEQLHYGNFYAEWLKCKLCTEKITENCSINYTEKITQSLLHSMRNRTRKLLKNDGLISCLYLDPRFNHTLTTTQKFEAATYLKKLYETIKTLNVHTQNENLESTVKIEGSMQFSQKADEYLNEYLTQNFAPTTSERIDVCANLESTFKTEGSMQFSQKADEYLNEYLTRNFAPTTSERIDVCAKIENVNLPYLRVDSNILQFWKDKKYSDPELYVLSNICFAIPPTQVTIERAFPSLKLILTDNRNRINQDTLENILLVKLNAVHLDHAIETLPLFEKFK